MKKVVLAFSGGLDTSYCAIYLAKEMGLEVHAALANTGGSNGVWHWEETRNRSSDCHGGYRTGFLYSSRQHGTGYFLVPVRSMNR